MGKSSKTLHFMKVGAYTVKKDGNVGSTHQVWISYDEMKAGMQPRIRFASDKHGTSFNKDTLFEKQQGPQKLDQIDFFTQLKTVWAGFCDTTGNAWKSNMAQSGRKKRLEVLRDEWLKSNDADDKAKITRSGTGGNDENGDTRSSSQILCQRTFPGTRIKRSDGHIQRRQYERLSRSADKVIGHFLEGHIELSRSLGGTVALWILESAFLHKGFQIDREATKAAYYELKANANLENVVQTEAWNNHLPLEIEQREVNRRTKLILSGKSFGDAKVIIEREQLEPPPGDQEQSLSTATAVPGGPQSQTDASKPFIPTSARSSTTFSPVNPENTASKVTSGTSALLTSGPKVFLSQKRKHFDEHLLEPRKRNLRD